MTCMRCGKAPIAIKKANLCKPCYQKARRERLQKARVDKLLVWKLVAEEDVRAAEKARKSLEKRAQSYYERLMMGEPISQIAQSVGLKPNKVCEILRNCGFPTTNRMISKGLSPRMKQIVWMLITLDRYIDIRGPSDCWLWQGDTITVGTSKYVVQSSIHAFDPLHAPEPRRTKAYRIMYMLYKGPIPDDMVVDHICFEPLCCNPAHLQLLTREENSARKDPSKSPL